MKSLVLLACVYSAPLFPSSFSDMLLGGSRIDSAAFPEILYIEVGNGYCSATVVGPRAILTAAHCIADGDGHIMPYDAREAMAKAFDEDVYDPDEDGIPALFQVNARKGFHAQCYVHPQYKKRADYDFALCVSDVEFASYATLARDIPGVRDTVTLAGFGCTRPDGSGGNNGSLRMGNTTVVKTPSKRNRSIWFYTEGTTALCFGDSGGPAFKELKSDAQLREVIGVNSRGDIRTVSLLSSVGDDGAKKWFKWFEKQFDVGICGMSLRCRPGNGAVQKRVDFIERPETDPDKVFASRISLGNASLERHPRALSQNSSSDTD